MFVLRKTEVDALFGNIDFSNYYTKTEVDDIDNELSTLVLNIYTKPEVDSILANQSYTSSENIGLIND